MKRDMFITSSIVCWMSNIHAAGIFSDFAHCIKIVLPFPKRNIGSCFSEFQTSSEYFYFPHLIRRPAGVTRFFVNRVDASLPNKTGTFPLAISSTMVRWRAAILRAASLAASCASVWWRSPPSLQQTSHGDGPNPNWKSQSGNCNCGTNLNSSAG